MAAEVLEDALGRVSQDMEVEEDRGREVEDKDEEGGTQRAMGALEFLTQEAEPRGTTLVNARNGFNKLSRLAMLWIMRHCWPAGARLAFN